MTSLKPRPGKLILRHLTDDEVSETFGTSIIEIPDSVKARQKVAQGVVVAVGEGVDEIFLQPGVRVIYDRFRTTPFRYEDQDLYTIWEEDIKAII